MSVLWGKPDGVKELKSSHWLENSSKEASPNAGAAQAFSRCQAIETTALLADPFVDAFSLEYWTLQTRILEALKKATG